MVGTYKGKKGDGRSWFKRIFRRPHIRKHKSIEANDVRELTRTFDQKNDENQNSDHESCQILQNNDNRHVKSYIESNHEPASSPLLKTPDEVGNVELSKLNFKNELASVLATNPPRLPIPKPIVSRSSNVRNEEAAVAETVVNTEHSDAYFGVAMQRINLNRQRGPRTPSRYAADSTSTFNMTASDISFDASRDLDLISEETSDPSCIAVNGRDKKDAKYMPEGYTFDCSPSTKITSKNPVNSLSSTSIRSSENLFSGDAPEDVTSNKKLNHLQL